MHWPNVGFNNHVITSLNFPNLSPSPICSNIIISLPCHKIQSVHNQHPHNWCIIYKQSLKHWSENKIYFFVGVKQLIFWIFCYTLSQTWNNVQPFDWCSCKFVGAWVICMSSFTLKKKCVFPEFYAFKGQVCGFFGKLSIFFGRYTHCFGVNKFWLKPWSCQRTGFFFSMSGQFHT